MVARDSANRWVDNIQTLEGWLKKRFAGNEAAVAGLFKEVRRPGEGGSRLCVVASCCRTLLRLPALAAAGVREGRGSGCRCGGAVLTQHPPLRVPRLTRRAASPRTSTTSPSPEPPSPEMTPPSPETPSPSPGRRACGHVFAVEARPPTTK